MTAKLKKDSLKVEFKTLLALLIVAFVVRLACAYGLHETWWAGDSYSYLGIAKNLVFHHAFSQRVGIPTAWRPPLYPFLIAALWWGDNAPLTAVVFVQIILGTATVALVYLIALDHFNRTVALIAAIGMSFAPMTVYFTPLILTETLFTFLLMLGVFFWGRNRTVLAGLAFGFAALTRTTIVPFLLLLPLLSLTPPWRPHRRAYLVMFAVAMAVSSVWIVRNAIVFNRFILIQSGGFGLNLYGGTIETDINGENPWAKIMGGLESERESGLDETEVDRIFMRRAIERIRSNPTGYLKTRLKQYRHLFLDNGDYLLGSRNTTFTAAWQESRPFIVIAKIIFMLGNIIVLLLTIYGIFVERDRFVSLSPIILFPIFLLLVHIPMWVEKRYSLPMSPFLAILASAGLVRFIGSRFIKSKFPQRAPKNSLERKRT